MLQMDIFNFHRVEYIVVDTGMAVFDREGIAKLASYRHGVGADRVLLVDKSLGQLVAAADGKGCWQMVSAYDCQVARAAFGSIERPKEMQYRELRVTDYFLGRLLAEEAGKKLSSEGDLKIAG